MATFPAIHRPDELLSLALQKEHQAEDLYADLAQRCQVGLVRELLERLRNEEHKHARMIEEMQARLRMGHDPV